MWNNQGYGRAAACRLGVMATSLIVITNIVFTVGLEELNDTGFAERVTDSSQHIVVLWREKGMGDPDEAVRAFEDAARQFEVTITKVICL